MDKGGKSNMKTRIISLLLVIIMVLGLTPTALASYNGAGGTGGTLVGSGVAINQTSFQKLMGQGLRFYAVNPEGQVVSSVYDLLSATSIGGGTAMPLTCITHESRWLQGTKLGYPITEELIKKYKYTENYDTYMSGMGLDFPPTTYVNRTFSVYGNQIKDVFSARYDIDKVVDGDGGYDKINPEDYANYADDERLPGVQGIAVYIIDAYLGAGIPALHIDGLTYDTSNSPINSGYMAENGYSLHIETILWAYVNGTTFGISNNWVYGTVTEVGQYCLNARNGVNTNSLVDSTALTMHTFALKLAEPVTYNEGYTYIRTVTQPTYVYLSGME